MADALLEAVIEPRRKGAIDRIKEACAAGADPNRICPETSSSHGLVRGGTTLLTYAISQENVRVVETLLECGASPDLADRLGWTPWMASTAIDESKRARMQSLLAQFGATTSGEHIGTLARAIFAGDVVRAESLIVSNEDPKILSTFRVDLVARQVATRNESMLALLLAREMPVEDAHLGGAVRGDFLAGVTRLLAHGLPPEREGDEETPLMIAASLGALDVVKCLVDAGADVNRSMHGNIEWTAAFAARSAGHEVVADWLAAQMDTRVMARIDALAANRNPRFARLYEQATGGEGASTDAIVDVLERWDGQFGVDIVEAAPDRVIVAFATLPSDIDAVVADVEALAPELDGGARSIANELRRSKTVTLWWD